MSEELKPKIEALRQAMIEIAPYYADLQHDISDIVYDSFSDDVQAGVSAEYTQLSVSLAPALVREIDELRNGFAEAKANEGKFAVLLRQAQKYVRKDWILTASEDARALSVEIGAALKPFEENKQKEEE
jgi:hypothetical protein